MKISFLSKNSVFRQRWQNYMDRANRYLEFFLTNPHNVERNHRLRAMREKDNEEIF